MHGFQSVVEIIQRAAITATRPELVDIAVAALGVMFILSGALKLRSPEGAASALANFGVIQRPHRAAGIALAIGGSGIGVLLITDLARMPALAATTGLLLLFAYAIARALQRGAGFACFCFGGSAPLSAREFVRTGMFAVAAATLLVVAPERHDVGLLDAALELLAAGALVSVISLISALPGLLRVSEHRHGEARA